MSNNIEYQLNDGVAAITINDAENGNRVSDHMAGELTKLITEASDSSKIIVLRTTGEDFCLGRSVMGEKPGKLPEAYVMRKKFDVIFQFYNAFRESKAPIIGGVQGRATGFGCAMAALCDITVATDTSIYQLPETSHGIMPTMAMSSLVDRVSRKAITYMTYSADEINAEHALSIGIISQIVPEGELNAGVDHIVSRMKKIPLSAVHAVKEFTTYSIGLPISTVEQYARNLHATINSSESMREE